MNRRQKKKAYKKKHGYNPPKTDVRYYKKEYARLIARKVEDIKDKVNAAISIIQKWVAGFTKIAADTMTKIQTMPEEEFNRILDTADLDEETKEMARRIREKGVLNHDSNN